MTHAIRRRTAAASTAVLTAALLCATALASPGPATAATDDRSTDHCETALPGVSAVTTTSITWTIPTSPCPGSGATVRLYTSEADAQTATNVVATGFADYGIRTLTVTGLKSHTDYWWSFGSSSPIGGPAQTFDAWVATTTTTPTRPTTTRPTTATTTRPTTTTTTRPTTATCQPALPGVSAVTTTSITWTIPSSPCPSVGAIVRLYTSQADARAGTNIVATGFADFGITRLTVTGLKSYTDYWWSFGGTLPIGGPTRTAAWSTTPTPTSTTATSTPIAACTASYTVRGQWTGGFQAEVTITAGSAPITGWTASWTLASGQTISQFWNATLTTVGSTVTAKSPSWYGTQGAGTVTTFGFVGSGPADGPAPVVTCTTP